MAHPPYTPIVLLLASSIGQLVRGLAGAAAVAVLGGCIGGPRGVRACSRLSPPGNSTICAFGVPGVRASIADIDNGVRVTLSARGDAAELRRRARDALEERPGPWQIRPEHRPLLRKSRLAFLDEPEGVTIYVRAIDPADLGELRSVVHWRVERAQSSVCD